MLTGGRPAINCCNSREGFLLAAVWKLHRESRPRSPSRAGPAARHTPLRLGSAGAVPAGGVDLGPFSRHHVFTMEDFEPDPATSSKTEKSDSLAGKTANGFLWMLGQTFGSKVAAFASQIVLARLLSPRDFGLVALAYAAVAFAGVIRQTGIQQILIQRHKHFRRWANPAFWFEFTIGVATALLLAATSPVAAAIFHNRAVIGLILVIAAAAPLSPWYVVASARLMVDMRFKAIALVNLAFTATTMICSILLAWRGFGAYSFVIPLPIASLIRAALLWYLARPKIGLRPQLRRWRFLIKDSGLLLVAGFLNSVMFWAGNIALGLMHSKSVVGEYFFALNLSTQVSQLISQNLGSVLLPALAKLQHDPPRQAAALIRASRLLAFISTPLCLLLAVAAAPLVDVIFGVKWLRAVPVLQILAVAAAIYIPSSPSATALQSQGRFTLFLRWTGLQAAAYFTLVLSGSWVAGAVGVATASLLFQLPTGPATIRLAVRGEGYWPKVWQIYAGPVAAGVLAMGPVVLGLRFGIISDGNAAWLAAAFSAAGLLYPLAARVTCPTEWHQALGYASSIATRVRRPRP